jgi:hypothetical protein
MLQRKLNLPDAVSKAKGSFAAAFQETPNQI